MNANVKKTINDENDKQWDNLLKDMAENKNAILLPYYFYHPKVLEEDLKAGIVSEELIGMLKMLVKKLKARSKRNKKKLLRSKR